MHSLAGSYYDLGGVCRRKKYQKLGDVFMHLPRFGWSSYALTKRWVMFPMPCVIYKDLREVRMHLQGFGWRSYAPTRIWVMASYTYQVWVTLSCTYQNECGWWRHAPTRLWMMTSCTYQTVGDAVMHLPGTEWRCHAPTRAWVTLSCTYQGLGDAVMHVPDCGWCCPAHQCWWPWRRRRPAVCPGTGRRSADKQRVETVGRKEHYSTAITNTHYEPQTYIFGLSERNISQKAQGLPRKRFSSDRCLRGFCGSVFSACTVESEMEWSRWT